VQAILAVHTQHNATAALMIDGKVVGCASEEKFTLLKNQAGIPINAINWLLAEYDVDNISELIVAASICDIDDTEHDLSENITTFQQSFTAFLYRLSFRVGLERIIWEVQYFFWKRKKPSVQASISSSLRSLLSCKISSISFYDHHKCHAAGALAFGDFGAGAISLVLDGQGDMYSGGIYQLTNNDIIAKQSFPWIYSLGEFYARLTAYLGFKPLEHEYKVMGLSPYSLSKHYYKKLFNNSFKDIFKVASDLSISSRMPTYLSDKVLSRQLLGNRFDNIAACMQQVIEATTLKLVAGLQGKIPSLQILAAGGGLFMNVKMNMFLEQNAPIDELSVMPSCGDDSLPIGALSLYQYRATSSWPKYEHKMYLGPRIDEDQIFEQLQASGLSFQTYTHGDRISKAVELLVRGHVIGRCCGRSEWGARSLGNRALLARPDRFESFFKINDLIKQRDFWMPFAPTILDHFASKYLQPSKNYNAEYMIKGYNLSKLGERHLAAAKHQGDNTVRPQILKQKFNPDYYELISSFADQTGIYGLLNTSYNIHGMPLASLSSQVADTFCETPIQALMTDNYLIIKTCDEVQA